MDRVAMPDEHVVEDGIELAPLAAEDGERIVANDLDIERIEIEVLARHLEHELTRQGLAAGRVVLKVRYADQGTQTRSQVLGGALRSAPGLHEAGLRLLDRTQVGSRPVRGLGLQLGKLAPAAESERQLDLFPRDS